MACSRGATRPGNAPLDLDEPGIVCAAQTGRRRARHRIQRGCPRSGLWLSPRAPTPCLQEKARDSDSEDESDPDFSPADSPQARCSQGCGSGLGRGLGWVQRLL